MMLSNYNINIKVMLEKVQLKSLDETCEDPHLHEATKMLLTMNKVNHTREELHYIL